MLGVCIVFFFQAEDGIRDLIVTGVQTCALPISASDDAVSVAAEPYGPISTCAPPSMSSAYAGPARTASDPSSFRRSPTRRPRSPPAALVSSCQRRRPWRYSAAAPACAPLSDTTAPTTIASCAVATPRHAQRTTKLVIQPVIDGMAAHGNEARALESHEHRAV